jgi:hypothetical protein
MLPHGDVDELVHRSGVRPGMVLIRMLKIL